MIAYVETAILLFLLLEIIVIYFYCKDYAAAQACDGIGDEHRPDYIWLVQQSLQHKGSGSYSHHQECWQGNAVCVACAYSFNGLWKKTKYQSNACNVSANGV